jgi:hypothetical protein
VEPPKVATEKFAKAFVKPTVEKDGLTTPGSVAVINLW